MIEGAADLWLRDSAFGGQGDGQVGLNLSIRCCLEVAGRRRCGFVISLFLVNKTVGRSALLWNQVLNL